MHNKDIHMGSLLSVLHYFSFPSTGVWFNHIDKNKQHISSGRIGFRQPVSV